MRSQATWDCCSTDTINNVRQELWTLTCKIELSTGCCHRPSIVWCASYLQMMAMQHNCCHSWLQHDCHFFGRILGEASESIVLAFSTHVNCRRTWHKMEPTMEALPNCYTVSRAPHFSKLHCSKVTKENNTQTTSMSTWLPNQFFSSNKDLWHLMCVVKSRIAKMCVNGSHAAHNSS